MRRLALTLALLLPVALGLQACNPLGPLERGMLYHPQPRSLAPHQSAWTLHAPDADLVVTTLSQAGEHAVLYFGGNAEDVSWQLTPFAQAFPHQALYLLHYRGYGGSGGTPTEAALQADALALYDAVRATHPRITVVGRSLGTGVAVRVAAERPVERLVLITPYDSIVEIAAAHLPYLPVRWLQHDRWESWRHAPAVRAPTTLLIAADDTVTPPDSARRLFTYFAPGVARTVVLPHVGHNNVQDSPGYLPALAGTTTRAAGDAQGLTPHTNDPTQPARP